MRNVLVTGGSEGIGLGLATRFLTAGSTVLITGRSLDKLERAARVHPGLAILPNDIARPDEREKRAAHVRAWLPDLDMVINNAGIQRRIALAADDAPWPQRQAELDILLAGPIHLNHLLIPTMLAHGRPSAIVNVTSGGAFAPQPFGPVYSACKAALHSYTVNLRYALAHTPCNVLELIPPAIATALAGPGASHGAPLEDFCDAVFPALAAGSAEEIGYGLTDSPAIHQQLDAAAATFRQFATRFPTTTYA